MACALFPVETSCAFSAARSTATSKEKSPATSRIVPKECESSTASRKTPSKPTTKPETSCVETTMNDPRDFKVLRPKHGDPHSKTQWRPLRRGIADIYRRAQVGQASNDRYLDALAATDTSTPLGELIRDICKPATYHHKRVRALRPWADPDLALLRAINRGEFSVNGFRNRDLQPLLFDHAPDRTEDKPRRSARVSRLLRMLRAHHLIQKVPHTHRYVLTPHGRDIISAVLASLQITLEQLNKLAA